MRKHVAGRDFDVQKYSGGAEMFFLSYRVVETLPKAWTGERKVEALRIGAMEGRDGNAGDEAHAGGVPGGRRGSLMPMGGIWHGGGERLFRRAAFHRIGKRRFPAGLGFAASRRNVFSWHWISRHGEETVSRMAGFRTVAGKRFPGRLDFAVSWKNVFPKG